MAYEYKEKFKSYTHGRISEPAVESGKREREELDEVYRKAELYDLGKKMHVCDKCGDGPISFWHNFCPSCGVKIDWGDAE